MADSATDMIIRYVPRSLVERYVAALGWIAHYHCFDSIHHGAYSVICEWPVVNGEIIKPKGGAEQ